MPSMHAWRSFSLASSRQRCMRLLSLCNCSASTNRPQRSSKPSSLKSAFFCCSKRAAAMPSSLSALSFSIVGSLSIVVFLGVGRGGVGVIRSAAYVFVLVCVGRGLYARRLGQWHAVRAASENRFDVLVRARSIQQGSVACGFQPHFVV